MLIFFVNIANMLTLFCVVYDYILIIFNNKMTCSILLIIRLHMTQFEKIHLEEEEKKLYFTNLLYFISIHFKIHNAVGY